MDIFQLIGALVLAVGGAYALWLVLYRWDSTLADDDSLQRLAGVFGPTLARVIAGVFASGFMLVGLALIVRGLFF